jgi:hypothetical protein
LVLAVSQSSGVPQQMNNVRYVNALDGRMLQHRGEFFEVYSHPFKLRYAEALHTFEAPVHLPKNIVQRFYGRVMAVTGYETNWEVLTESGTWREAKCTEAYTHHFQLYLFSSKASEEVVDRNLHPNDDNPWEPHISNRRAVPVHAPLVQTFMEGNGNENRGSFHGLPEGFAQLIDSPAYFRNLYHVINTKSPSGNASWGPGTDAPLPRNSLAPPGAAYSGLVECPCSTRRGDYHHTGILAQDAPFNNTGKKFKDLCSPGGSLEMQKNSICHAETYRGGLQCCDEGMIMIDADQVQPYASTFRYRMRWYFEDPAFSSHYPKEAFFLFAETENWQSEFDIPKLPPPSVHVLQRNFRARQLFGGLLGWNSPHRFNCSRITTAMCGGISEVEAAGGTFELRYAHFHQHVGMIGGTLVNADTGELLCETKGIYGTGQTPLNELGYVIGIPPCVWQGSSAPRLHLNTNLTSTSHYNASHAHLAVMSMWEMRGALLSTSLDVHV